MKFVPAKLSRFIGKVGMKVAKRSPEILLVTGIGTGIASTVMACKATLKVDGVLDEHRQNMDNINEAIESYPDEYTLKDKKRDTAVVYGKTIGNFIKLYSPAIILGAISIASICGSYGIMRKRNVALTIAYGELMKNFSDYRARVKEKYGDDADREIIFGNREEEVETDADGNVTSVKSVNDNICSQYGKFFDSSNPNWEKAPEYNITFLSTVQQMFNDKLRARGHVFLNEVYEALGFDHTAAGAVVGWIWNGDEGDNYIDFGIFDASKNANRRFVNGYENVILLDFNVDGVIYDKI